jgi:hypothetical protein
MSTEVNTTTVNATITSTMINEQETAGASNRVEDAPSVEAFRVSKRARKDTQKVLENQRNHLLESSPRRRRGRKRKATQTMGEATESEMRRVSRKQTVSRGDGDLYSCERGDVLGGRLTACGLGCHFTYIESTENFRQFTAYTTLTKSHSRKKRHMASHMHNGVDELEVIPVLHSHAGPSPS